MNQVNDAVVAPASGVCDEASGRVEQAADEVGGVCPCDFDLAQDVD